MTYNLDNEYHIPEGTEHACKRTAGTRTIHAFGEQRIQKMLTASNGTMNLPKEVKETIPDNYHRISFSTKFWESFR